MEILGRLAAPPGTGVEEDVALALVWRLLGEVGGGRWLNERVLPSCEGVLVSPLAFCGMEESVTVELLLVRLLFLRNCRSGSSPRRPVDSCGE